MEAVSIRVKRLLALVLCLQLGCASSLSRHEDAPKHTFEHRCRPVQALPKGLMPYGTMSDSPRSPNEINALASATQFTPQSVRIAHAIGALHLLVRLPAAERALRQKPETLSSNLKYSGSRSRIASFLPCFRSPG